MIVHKKSCYTTKTHPSIVLRLSWSRREWHSKQKQLLHRKSDIDEDAQMTRNMHNKRENYPSRTSSKDNKSFKEGWSNTIIICSPASAISDPETPVLHPLVQQPNYPSTWRLEPHHCLLDLRHPTIKVNPDAFVILTFFWLQAVSLTIRGVCSRTPRAHRVDTVFHSKQSLSAIKVLANGDLLVNRIIESEKQRVWTKAVYPSPTKKS